ncbi:hypothetical protein RB195_005937 [Necator americanus]|uniref:Uncharacterized protein n=1 Tax=Necator americanus TaxID=51031 RepID=A0ABR1BU27_NECAM
MEELLAPARPVRRSTGVKRTEIAKVPFAEDELNRQTCCTYEDPLNYAKHPAKYLILDTPHLQNPRYFEDVMSDIHEMFTFGEKAARIGMKQVKDMGM